MWVPLPPLSLWKDPEWSVSYSHNRSSPKSQSLFAAQQLWPQEKSCFHFLVNCVHMSIKCNACACIRYMACMYVSVQVVRPEIGVSFCLIFELEFLECTISTRVAGQQAPAIPLSPPPLSAVLGLQAHSGVPGSYMGEAFELRPTGLPLTCQASSPRFQTEQGQVAELGHLCVYL